jgi:hypothetical protein
MAGNADMRLVVSGVGIAVIAASLLIYWPPAELMR